MASGWSNLRRTPAANSLHANGVLSTSGCRCATRSLVARTTSSFPRDNVAKSSASHAEEMATLNCDLLVYRVFAQKPPDFQEISLSRSDIVRYRTLESQLYCRALPGYRALSYQRRQG